MENTKDRSIKITKTLNLHIHQIWDLWTIPEHLEKWWGPNGFTATIHQFDLEVDGNWKMTLHGPDGTNFPNKSIFKAIIPLKKIVFEHFYPHFMTTVIFKSLGEETNIDWTLLFNTVEMRDTIVKVHKADEGQKQNIEKLEKYIEELSAK